MRENRHSNRTFPLPMDPLQPLPLTPVQSQKWRRRRAPARSLRFLKDPRANRHRPNLRLYRLLPRLQIFNSNRKRRDSTRPTRRLVLRHPHSIGVTWWKICSSRLPDHSPTSNQSQSPLLRVLERKVSPLCLARNPLRSIVLAARRPSSIPNLPLKATLSPTSLPNQQRSHLLQLQTRLPLITSQWMQNPRVPPRLCRRQHRPQRFQMVSPKRDHRWI